MPTEVKPGRMRTDVPVGVRAKSTVDTVSKGDHKKKTALAEHVLSYEQPHEINWRSLSVFNKAKNTKDQNIREAFNRKKKERKKAWPKQRQRRGKKVSYGMPFFNTSKN